ncbi:RAD10 [Auxenochlorella protothecoides x Auxenochlorella symbiontica]|uniref:DNA excision repair protein ERCC-1 n=1 Tax=Auxenochlorella protothecoides TaxID=3075 RepID=A0A1D2A6D2_AUXPR
MAPASNGASHSGATPGAQQSNPPTTSGAPQLNEAQLLALNPNAVLVSKRQEGNPVLRHMRNVRWQFGDIVPDYLAGPNTAILFLSLRFHLLKPEYIYGRMKALQRAYRLRVLLCHVDTEDAVGPLGEVTKAAIGLECTLICGFSPQECARYIETYKSYESKPADSIQKSVGSDFVSTATAALTSLRGVNKTDVKTLGDRFGSMAALFSASKEELALCPGLGPTKVKRLFEAFHEPFRNTLVPQAAPEVRAASLGRPSQVFQLVDAQAAAEVKVAVAAPPDTQAQPGPAVTDPAEDPIPYSLEDEDDDDFA